MFTINCKGKLLVIDKPLIMGIINLTNDSFYSDSCKPNIEGALLQANKMIGEGASILDIGGQSTRPGSERIGEDEEADRILPIIDALNKQLPHSIISVDTYYASVAERAIHAGASIVNDISAGRMDERMLTIVGELEVPYICMHMQGSPATMQENPHYDDVVKEVLEFFIERIEICKKNNIHDIIIDPGFGFGKSIQHNFLLLKNLAVFKMLERPILAGLSRKGMIYKSLENTPEHALNGTTVLNTIALMNSASVLRVHDALEAAEAVKLMQVYISS